LNSVSAKPWTNPDTGTQTIPRDMGDMISPDERKDLFLKTMLPLVLLANERIERDRTRLERLHALTESGYTLSPRDQVWLARLAGQYGIDNTSQVDTRLLLRRVDIVPVSLTLAQAAEESGWGTSRFAQQGNALFGQQTWSARHTGIVPRNRQEGERHRFRSFDDLSGSVQSYMHNLNTHRAYLDFRRQRASLRTAGKPVDGYKLASHIERYSERGQDYIAAVRRLMRVNGLTDFDRAVLLRDGPELVLHVLQPDGVEEGEPGILTVALPVDPADPADTAAVHTEDGAF
jgi:Bax protein